MAVVGIKLNLNTEELRDLRDRLTAFLPKPQATDVIADAIKKAIQPMTRRLREITPVGPTGNLKRAVASKVVKYRKDGVAVGLVGYNRSGKQSAASAAGGEVKAGKDRAFHQWWLEYGTKERKITIAKARQYQRQSPTRPFTRTRRRNGVSITEEVRGTGILHNVQERTPTYIASSFNRLGPFRVLGRVGGDGRMQTDPPYPRAFFKKSKSPIVIGETPAGGVAGRPPLNTAFLETQEQMADILRRELSLSLSQAWNALQFRNIGTVTGTDTL